MRTMVFLHADDAAPNRWWAAGFARFARPDALPPPLLMLIGMLSTQIGAAFAKGLFGVAGPAGLTLLRLGFAALALLWLARRAVAAFRWPGWATARIILLFGLAMAGMNLGFYAALRHVPLGVAVTIAFLGPLVVALVGGRRARDVGWALLAGAGVLLLTGLGQPVGGIDRTGLLIAAGNAVCWGAYILLGSALSARDAGAGLALGMTVAALLVLPLGLLESGAALTDPTVLVAGIGVALLSSVVPYTAELAALRRLPAQVFAVLLSLEPAIAAVVGIVVLHEWLSPLQLAGIACVAGASVAASRSTYAPPDGD